MMPFGCEISQINIKGNNLNNKIAQFKTEFEAGVDSSNLLLEELGIDKRISKMEEVIKGIFIATASITHDYKTLNETQIKLVVNCAADKCKNLFLNDFHYQWIFMPDPLLQEFNLECLVYAISDSLRQYISESNNILFHCYGYDPEIKYSGSRSISLLVGYLMCTLNIEYEDAFELVRKKWSIDIPDFLRKQLEQLSKRRKTKIGKGYRVYAVCSYTDKDPKHLVAKYVIC